MWITRLIASSSVHGGHVAGKSVGATLPAASALSSRYEMTSPFSQWNCASPPAGPITSSALQMNSSLHMRSPRFL